MSRHWLTSKTNRYEVIVVAKILGECLLQSPYALCTVFPRIMAGGDYSREAIISNISIKGGAIIQGRRLIERLLLFKEYTVFCR